MNREHSPWAYQALLGKGTDADGSRTRRGREYDHTRTVKDFAEAGIRHGGRMDAGQLP